ncbi:hypothetical protein Goari_015464 [Gossypium aridum]|uniref:RING-type E3 ubiquitin transferase n=1 Tax=Gossypium aridum TaxID=34290 RepID=A0A7J8WFM8_GOSAI|nr:hypothetical protein [Gossypium aridum]
MGDLNTDQGPSSSPLPLSSKSNLPMLYYGLVVVGTAAIVLAVYNLIVIRWCTQRPDYSRQRQTRLAEMAAGRSYESQSRIILSSSFKYKKGSIDTGSEEAGEHECAVCLSVFEDGDDVRQLPRCKHSFHAPCIDMWLYSHFDCPLCRTLVDPEPSLIRRRQTEEAPPQNPREDILGVPDLV